MNQKIIKTILSLAVLGMVNQEICAKIPKTVFSHRMIHVQFDLTMRKRYVDAAYSLMDRASKVGYNGLFVMDRFVDMHSNQTKLRNVDKYKEMLAYARSKGLTPMPHILNNYYPVMVDESIAEAIPVKGTRFLVNGKEAKISSDHQVAFKNGGFGAVSNGLPANWRLEKGKPQEVTVQSGVLTVTKPSNAVMLAQQVEVKPWRAYEIKVRIRTNGFDNAKYSKWDVFGADGKRKKILFRHHVGFGRWGLPATTSGFVEYTADFNSLECSKVKVVLVACRVGTGYYPSGSAGVIQFDDASIREVGLYETVRRPTLPYRVTSEDGGTVYTEGTDYQLVMSAPLLDAQRKKPLGQKILIPAGSKIKNGQAIRLDWWQNANMERVVASASYCLPKTWEIIEKTFENVDRVYPANNVWESKGARGAHVPFCEWRDGFWDLSCKAHYKNLAHYMGGTLEKMQQVMRKTVTNRELYVWSDMFDPYQNSQGGSVPYWMSNGVPYGSWESVPNDVIMMQWWAHPKGATTRLYAGMDPKYPKVRFRQLLGIADGAWSRKRCADLDKLEAEATKPLGVLGSVYVTQNYGPNWIEECAKVFKDAGRWGNGPLPGPEPVSTKRPQNVQAPQTGKRMVYSEGVLRFRMPEDARVRLQLFDAGGRMVQVLTAGIRPAGAHQIDLGKLGLATGVYVARRDQLSNMTQFQTTSNAKIVVLGQ